MNRQTWVFENLRCELTLLGSVTDEDHDVKIAQAPSLTLPLCENPSGRRLGVQADTSSAFWAASNMVARVGKLFGSRPPVVKAAITSGCIMVLGDALAQTVTRQKGQDFRSQTSSISLCGQASSNTVLTTECTCETSCEQP